MLFTYPTLSALTAELMKRLEPAPMSGDLSLPHASQDRSETAEDNLSRLSDADLARLGEALLE